MKVIFRDTTFGYIEVTQELGQEGQAYFQQDDFISTVNRDGSFKSMWGITFHVLWPVTKSSQHAILEVTTPRQIASALPERQLV